MKLVKFVKSSVTGEYVNWSLIEAIEKSFKQEFKGELKVIGNKIRTDKAAVVPENPETV